MANKEKIHFEDFRIGEQFTHNNFTYRKISNDYATTLSPSRKGEMSEVKRFFNGPTKVKELKK